MKQKRRYRRKPKGTGLIGDWPEDVKPATELAATVRYVGSNEHKRRPVDPSYDVDPNLRSDASCCRPDITREQAERVLREAIVRKCVSEDFESGYPRYAWGWLDGDPYRARLINREQGHYKAHPIAEFELPTDRSGRLDWRQGDGDA